MRNNQLCAATAKASVVTARKSPRTRSAGKPTSTAAVAPATVAYASATEKEYPFATSADAVTAPTPANAYWPSDSCPAQPVSTVTDRPAIATTSTLLKRKIRPADVKSH